MTPSRSSSAHPSLLHLKRIGEGVLLLAFAFFVGAITTWLIRPTLIQLVDRREWLTTALLMRVDLLLQAGTAVIALALIRRGPSLSSLFSIHTKATLSLCVITASFPWLAAAIAIPDELSLGFFSPLSPFTTNPYLWLGVVLPLLTSAFQEELFYRALMQPLLSRLLFSEWAGAIAAAILFTVNHPPEHIVVVLPGAVLFAVVFMHTRSIVCTTLLHLTMNISLDLLTRTVFTLTVFLPKEVFDRAQPVYGALLLVFAAVFHVIWRRSVSVLTLGLVQRRCT